MQHNTLVDPTPSTAIYNTVAAMDCCYTATQLEDAWLDLGTSAIGMDRNQVALVNLLFILFIYYSNRSHLYRR
jgi:hypothetical protein